MKADQTQECIEPSIVASHVHSVIMGVTWASGHYVCQHLPVAILEFLKVHIVSGDGGSPAIFYHPVLSFRVSTTKKKACEWLRPENVCMIESPASFFRTPTRYEVDFSSPPPFFRGHLPGMKPIFPRRRHFSGTYPCFCLVSFGVFRIPQKVLCR